ncbi:DUF637 domain-containing protein [Marinibactrum halimedae]|uniref:DUF637 domain-containing protein n=1 Tax=Marinibactrum halimedae TaxID=1444977 RepID=A0AA37T4A2_9GAMM|nr:DUF637 domain-containing protein [Marinibactrum halimedae]MCD9457818.1 DUF637 domain-containing protein [Marinibactrum halimedae]GLS24808.1 hypothetical protein GCM10007877_05220 [Marinibactrum halimedae]
MTSKSNSAQFSVSLKIIACALSFLMVFQSTVAVAANLPNSAIEEDIRSNPIFRWLDNMSYLYQADDYVETLAPQGATTIEYFWQRLFNNYQAGLGNPNYVPISVGDGLTTIIPIFDSAKSLGTPLVQSRYVRQQVRGLLGRTLIDSDKPEYTNERAQLNTLYNNAYNYARANQKQFGDVLGFQQDGVIESDMIWPEYRTLFGQRVVVPIVYLSQDTIDKRKVDGHVVEFNNVVEFSDLAVDGVNLQFGRNAVLNVAGSLLNNSGSFNGSGDLTIIAEQLSNLQGDITAQRNLNMVVEGGLYNASGLLSSGEDMYISAGDFQSETLVHLFDNGDSRGGVFGEVAEITSENGSVNLRTSNDINLIGTQVRAGQNIRFGASGNINIGSSSYSTYDDLSGRTRWRNYERSSTEYLTSSLSAKESIELIASGEIKIDAADIIADEGHIEILAGLGITIEDDLRSEQFYREGKFGKKSVTESTYQTVAIRSLLDAGKNIRLHAEFGDITLRATDIRSNEGASVTADNGQVKLLVTKETDHYSYSSIAKRLFTVKTVNRGHNIENVVHTTIVGGFEANALYGLNVEYEGDPNLTFDEQLNELEKMPGLAPWVKEAKRHAELNNVDWTLVEAEYKKWNDSSTTLNAAALAIITIVVAIVTAGAGAAMIGAAGTTAGTTTALGAAMNAGFTAMINTATIAMANVTVNGGNPEDIFRAGFEAVHSEEGARTIATSAVTAGALQAIDAQFFEVARGSELSLADQMLQVVTHSAVNAGINTIVNGGGFEESFIQALAQNSINLLGQNATKRILNSNELGDALKNILSASNSCIVGAATAGLQGENAESACISSAASTTITNIVRGNLTADLTEKQKELSSWFEENIGEGILGLSNEELQAYLNNGQHLPLDILPRIQEFSQLQNELGRLTRRSINISRLTAGVGALIAGASGASINIADGMVSNVGWSGFTADRAEVDDAVAIYDLLTEQNNLRTLRDRLYSPWDLVQLDYIPEEWMPHPNAPTQHITGDQLFVMHTLASMEEFHSEAEADYKEQNKNAVLPYHFGDVNWSELIRMAFREGPQDAINAYIEETESEIREYESQDITVVNREELRMMGNQMQRQFSIYEPIYDAIDQFGAPSLVTRIGAEVTIEAVESVASMGVLIGRALDRSNFGNILTKKTQEEALEIIATESKNKRNRMVALSRTGIPELGVDSDSFTNIDFKLSPNTEIPGVSRPHTGAIDEVFTVESIDEYLGFVKKLYKDNGMEMHPIIERRIAQHLDGGTFTIHDADSFKGIPGLHAEVRAANDILNQVRAGLDYDVSRIQVATYRLNGGEGVLGEPFAACNHCGGILNGFEILTGTH